MKKSIHPAGWSRRKERILIANALTTHKIKAEALDLRIREAGREWEAEAVASAEAYAARQRARKPAGQATTADGAAIDPKARQA